MLGWVENVMKSGVVVSVIYNSHHHVSTINLRSRSYFKNQIDAFTPSSLLKHSTSQVSHKPYILWVKNSRHFET
jgi:hypothetical protein